MTRDHAASPELLSQPTVARLRAGLPAVWLRPEGSQATNRTPIEPSEISEAEQRLSRFRPVLAALFPEAGWDGRIRSSLLDYPQQAGLPSLRVKADHDLPMTGSVKARGGVYELLCRIETVALMEGIIKPGDALTPLLSPTARMLLSKHRVVVASTGNLGFSIGLVARAFGLAAEIHMSHEAKSWKKERLRRTGATVIEHPCDYTQTVARARAAASAAGSYFIDDETSRLLFVGYTAAASELAGQLRGRQIEIGPDRPLAVYLPCGVGGAPGGLTAGLKAIYGSAVHCVFVEPIASACVLAALAVGNGSPISVYEIGLDNQTIADGLAVPVASKLAMSSVGASIDAAVAVTDESMLDWVRRAWNESRLRLEPSAASGFAAVPLFLEAAHNAGTPLPAEAIHVVWTTGGSQLPEDQFTALLQGDPL
jgi:D-serine dehydratase